MAKEYHRKPGPNIRWPPIIAIAAEIVASYTTPVTLRQVFYRLVARMLIANNTSNYSRLSALTAEGRRQGTFPELSDRGRTLHRYASSDSPAAFLAKMVSRYRRDRTDYQPHSIYLGVEKGGMVAQFLDWFGDLGIPVVAVGGFSSQTYVDEIKADIAAKRRPAVLLYAGDLDASGEDIQRDFLKRTDCWDQVIRVALTDAQVEQFGLPVGPGKPKDSRNAAFIRAHGSLYQVELDAIEPNDLRALFQAAIDRFWDTAAYERVMEEERAERDRLAEYVDAFDPD